MCEQFLWQLQGMNCRFQSLSWQKEIEKRNGQEQLRVLPIVPIENEIRKNTNLEGIIKQFAEMKAIKV
jgi:hypothetical protein